jgi:serine/threonine-protein kinase
MAEPAIQADLSGESNPKHERIGSYRILAPLGTGGMSSVYRAVHVETGHEVAVKVLTRTLAKNATLLHRFLREAKSAEALVHPNIVTIYDRGIDSGRHYLVLEYVSGGDLHDYVHRGGPLSAKEAISITRQVASGLAYAAGRGLIHRDIKPSNLLRTPEGQIKIIDLGLALRRESEDERVTRDGTTVGTVDYMAPEQARDSRAAGIQSDIYSLGCTCYYLLTGVPAYPGGDITDKLARHAHAPVPDVCELRPDVPAELGSLLARMMAKLPEERFQSYDELIEAVDVVPADGAAQSPGVVLVPLPDQADRDLSLLFERPESGSSGEPRPPVQLTDSIYVLQRDEDLAGELPSHAHQRATSRQPSRPPAAPLPRVGHLAAANAPFGGSPPAVEPHADSAPLLRSNAALVAIIAAAAIGLCCLVISIGLVQLWDASPGSSTERPPPGALDLGAAPRPAAEFAPATSPAPRTAGSTAVTGVPAQIAARRRPGALRPPATAPVVKWEEPKDEEPVAAGLPRDSAAGALGSKQLPEWARLSVPERLPGKSVVVRRVAEPGDPATVPSLHWALESTVGGTVELADEGPLYVDDLHLSGDSRLIRARPGCRPIVRIGGATRELAQTQQAVCVLDRKTLVLDGIDFVIWVPDLASRQTALFDCDGANLTIRNCTFSILNPRAGPFAVIRVESTSALRSRIRFESTLVRGPFTAGIEIRGAPADLVLDHSVILGSGPLMRVVESETGHERNLFFIDTVLAGPGPIIGLDRAAANSVTRPHALRIWTYGSALGRFHGRSIASVISSSDGAAGADKQVEWVGEGNLFAGWNGFFACGRDNTITVPDLAAVRSTWGASEKGSQVILAPWPRPWELGLAIEAELSSFFLGDPAALLQAAQPRAGLFEKTIGSYPSPVVPESVARGAHGPGDLGGARRLRITKPMQLDTSRRSLAPGADLRLAAIRGAAGASELLFDTHAPPWNGDLGAYLHDRVPEGIRRARVRVLGSGSHLCTPVRLPRGLSLQIRVDASALADPPSWTPRSGLTGRGLIELNGGALLLEGVHMRHAADSRLEHLIQVENGHLVLARCQLIAPPATADFTGDLIEFRSISTQPRADDLEDPVFLTPLDRPVCRLDDSLLITGGRALRAELGLGLVALVQCAVAGGSSAIALYPSQVARSRFGADLYLEHCTLASEKNIIRMADWPGLPLGPDRPWLITSRNCAFLAIGDRKPRPAALLRSDPDALTHGAVFWQGEGDAADVDFFVVAGDGPASPKVPRDVQSQWVRFWGSTHMRGISGPRGPGSAPAVRTSSRLRPGHVEPADLILDPNYPRDREQVSVGADLRRQGILFQARPVGRPGN